MRISATGRQCAHSTTQRRRRRPNPALGDPSNIGTLELNFADKIDAASFIDVAATLRAARNYNIVAGINNLFDKEPPLGSGLSDIDFGPGFYGMYDHLGRYFFTGINFQF